MQNSEWRMIRIIRDEAMKHPVACFVLVAVFCVAGALSAKAATDPNQNPRRTPIVSAVEKVRGSVVNISTERVVLVRRGFSPSFRGRGDIFDRMFEDFFRGYSGRREVERRKIQTPLGSGCVITPDGLVVTNEHVIRRATNIKLSLDSGETFEAELLAADPTEDLALLRAKVGHRLQAIPMGTSSDLMLGETVLALGNPFGFENSVTSGILSALDREIAVGSARDSVKYTGLIQSSALINPGNSGGPLVNVLGELIGINTAIVDQAQGIGFSIPIDRARDVLAPLLASPQVSEAWPGFKGVTTEKRDGVRVSQVESKSPATKVLKPGDVIREIEGVPIKDLFDFLLRVVQHKAGEVVALRIVRDGKSVGVRLTLGRMPVPTPKKILRDKFRIAGQNLTPTLARQLRTAVDYGLLVSEVRRDSPALEVGLQRGDVIVQIGPHPVRTLHNAAAALRSVQPGERVFIRIVRGNYAYHAWITVQK